VRSFLFHCELITERSAPSSWCVAEEGVAAEEALAISSGGTERSDSRSQATIIVSVSASFRDDFSRNS
jgi:hypothetical protein